VTIKGRTHPSRIGRALNVAGFVRRGSRCQFLPSRLDQGVSDSNGSRPLPAIIGYGVISTPGLVVDEKVVLSGRVATAARVLPWFSGRARPRPASAGRRRATPADSAVQAESDRCRDRADEGESVVLLEAGWIETGDADGDREGGCAPQMETR
jgi:hypothetical protein